MPITLSPFLLLKPKLKKRPNHKAALCGKDDFTPLVRIEFLLIPINHYFPAEETPSSVCHKQFITNFKAVTEPESESGNAHPRIASYINIAQ